MNLTIIHRYFGLTEQQMKKLTFQHAAILWFIYQRGSITPMDAFYHLGITKLATRISEMKALGIQFGQVYESRPNEAGKKVHFMRYRKAA